MTHTPLFNRSENSPIRQAVAYPGTVRLGSVPYLNVQPVLRALSAEFHVRGMTVDIEGAVPSDLAQRWRAGHYDAAIIPAFASFEVPDSAILPGLCIAADGPVWSVLLVADGPLENVQRVWLDPASRTSNNLVQVLMKQRGQRVEFVGAAREVPQEEVVLQAGEGKVVIGDPALRLRGRYKTEWDLGAAWVEQTGLPFVFAAWVSLNANRARELGPVFESAVHRVEECIGVAAREDGPRFGFTADYAESYLREALRFVLGPRELAGLAKFRELCSAQGLL